MLPDTTGRSLTVLIPTCSRPAALAVTLTSLCGQTFRDFDVIISDQTEFSDPLEAYEVVAALRVLSLHGHRVTACKHLPRRGIAENREFLLDQAATPFVLYLDDDLVLEPDLIARLMAAIHGEDAAFAGSAPIGLSYLNELRPHQQGIEFWEGPVRPERIGPERAEWRRHELHSAANILHLQQRLGLTADAGKKYKVAWIGACILYETAKLRSVGGYSFWRDLPPDHCGEDVYVQNLLLARYGGFGIIPSGVYHQELPTTIPDRTSNAVDFFLSGNVRRGSRIMIEIPAGELLDKITILEIKSDKVADPAKLVHIREELSHLKSVRDRGIGPSPELDELLAQLRNVNESLWRIEDDLREHERRKEFDERFLSLARSVYHTNDRRAALKRRINELTGSRLVEEKSYADYEAA